MKNIGLHAKRAAPAVSMLAPVSLWLVLFIAVPMCFILGISMMTKDPLGGYIESISFSGYSKIASAGNLRVFGVSAWVAFLTTVICVFLGYPFAYIISRASKRMKGTLIMLIMLPFWTNSLIRTYGIMTIIRDNGILNNLLRALGVIEQPLQLLYTDGAVLLGMVYTLFPFMVLPLYSSLEKLDGSLLEAASDLGAPPVRAFFRVTLPLTVPGIFAGSIQVFIPTLGYFFISDMLGGGKTIYIGNLIKNQFYTARDWPFACALSMALIALTIILLKLYTKIGSMEDLA